MRISVSKQDVVAGALLEEAWELYRLAFDELRSMAIQRHLMYRSEFDEAMAEPRIAKYVVRDADSGALWGLSTMSNALETMPLVSPDYFQARWPDRYAADHCYCVGFVAVHPDTHGTGVFVDMVDAMTVEVGEVGGVVVIDFCTRNTETYHLPEAVLRITQACIPGYEGAPIDRQTYWAYEAPVPAKVIALEPAAEPAAAHSAGAGHSEEPFLRMPREHSPHLEHSNG